MLKPLKQLLSPFGVCAAVTLAVIWLNKYPAGIDLPQHANLFQLLANASDPHSGYAFFYSRDFFTPYALTYLLGWAFTKLGGALFACKLLISMAALGTAAAMTRWLRKVGADPHLGLFGFVVTFGFGYLWGFISFVMSGPIALLYFAQLADLRKEPTAKRLVITAALALLLFFTHGITFVFCMFAAVGICLFQRSPRQIAFELLHVVPAVACFLVWKSAQPLQRNSLEELATLERVVSLFSGPWSIDPSRPLALATVTGLLVLAFVGRARPSVSPARWLPFLLAVVGTLVLPDKVNGTSFVGSRFVQFVYWFGFAAFDVRLVGHSLARFHRLALAVVLLALVALEYRLVIFNRELEGLDEVAALIPPGSDLKLHGGVTRSESFGPGALGQVAAWVTAERGGFLENDFGRYFQVPVQRRPGQQWPEQFRYFVTRGTAEETRGFAGEAPKVLAHHGHFGLFSVEHTSLQLSDLELIRFAQSWGELRNNRSVEDRVLSVGGQQFTTGVGTHAKSVLQLRPLTGVKRLRGAVGVDDEAPGDASVTFTISTAARERLWASTPMKKGQTAAPFDVSLDGVTGDVFLTAEPTTESIAGAHADWLNLEALH